MTGFELFLVFMYAVFHAFACCHVAYTKGRTGGSAFVWFLLGGLFGVFALLTIGFCGAVDREREDQEEEERLARLKVQQEAATAKRT